MFAIAQQVGKQFDLRIIRHAQQRGIVRIQRHILNAAIAGIGQNWINGGDDFRPGDRGPLPTLNAQPDNDDAHTRSP